MDKREAIQALCKPFVSKETMAEVWRTIDKNGFETSDAYSPDNRMLYIPIAEQNKYDWLLFFFDMKTYRWSFFQATDDLDPLRVETDVPQAFAGITELLWYVARTLSENHWY